MSGVKFVPSIFAGFDDSSKYEARIPRVEFHALNTDGNHNEGKDKSRQEKLSKSNERNRIEDKPKLEIQKKSAVDKIHTKIVVESEEDSSANHEEDSNVQDEEWTFASSFLYSLSLITTMGKKIYV